MQIIFVTLFLKNQNNAKCSKLDKNRANSPIISTKYANFAYKIKKLLKYRKLCDKLCKILHDA